MAALQWEVFAGVALVTTAGVLVLTRLSSRMLFGAERAGSGEEREFDAAEAGVERAPPLPTGPALLLNLAFTHGLVALVLLAAAWYAGIPAVAFGVGPVAPWTLATAAALGVVIYIVSEAASFAAKRLGHPPDERLRSLLSPESGGEWALLLLVVLPTVAAAEELLFRGALIGAMAAGFGLSPWPLVVGSSVLFGFGHVAQGRLGILVTATLGVVLGVAFVLTGSLVVVIVAHYAVDVLEFVVHGWLLDDDEAREPPVPDDRSVS